MTSAEKDCPCGRGPGHVPIKSAGCTPTAENGLPAPIPIPEDTEVVQVVLLAPTFEWFQQQIRGRGLYLFPIPVEGDDLPTYGVGVGQRLMGRVLPPRSGDING